jgi:Tol biopolymer transport system component
MAAGMPSRTGSSSARRDRMRDPVVLALAAVALVAIAAVVMLWHRPTGDAPLPVARFELVFPDSVGAVADVPIPGAISPDGTTIAAFGIASATQESGLYLRKTDQLGLRLVPGTAQAYEPAFSPDGTWLTFMREDGEVNHLVKYRLADGKTEVVAATNSANGMDWVSPNELVLGQDGNLRGLSRLSAAGGGLIEFTHPDEHDQHAVHLWPVMANDGKTVVFAIYRGTLATAELAITSVPEGKITRLGIRGIRPLGILDDHLVFVQADGAVMAVPIDVGRRRLTGEAIPVHEPVDVTPTANGNSTIAMGRDGALLVFQGSFRARLAMAARGHAPVAISNELREFTDAVPSPDRSHIAFVSSHARPQIGMLDVATGAVSRFSTAARAWSPSWLADGKTLMYLASDADGRTAIMRQRLDAVAPTDTVYAPGDKTDYPVMVAVAAAPDGTHALLVAAHNNDYFGDLLEISISPDHPATARPFAVGPDNEQFPAFSPDGRWVSFVVRTPTGGDHLMVRSFPEPTSSLQISPDTLLAGRPFWSADGQSVGYQNQIGAAVFETRLKLTGGLAVLSRAAIPVPMPATVPGASGPPFSATAFARDGGLLGIKLESLSGGDVVVPNWITELRERIAASAAK